MGPNEERYLFGEIIKMFGLLKKLSYPIGIDISDDSLKMVQLENKGRVAKLIAGFSDTCPEDIQAGGGNWQRWAIETIRQWVSTGNFKSKDVIASIPAKNVFIELMKMPKAANNNELQNTIFSKIKQKLPFESEKSNIMIKYFPTIDDNILVMATEKDVIERHLAIYEKAGLAIKTMSIWPVAIVNSYTRFFGRRQSDIESVVMLIEIEKDYTNVVISRHKNLLFARTISIGTCHQEDESAITRLIMELTSCKRQFSSVYNNFQIDRLVFLSSRTEDRELCAEIAKKLEMPAQVGDCLAAAETADPYRVSREDKNKKKITGNPIDRRDNQANWAIAFGLSLSS
ncbi:MAG: pilus assembly protein PilM [Sedimentisphaerales bacterium]|nr:pilus assembly protein PilM [Sedimentisphaerales bacterium]